MFYEDFSLAEGSTQIKAKVPTRLNEYYLYVCLLRLTIEIKYRDDSVRKQLWKIKYGIAASKVSASARRHF